MSTKQHSRLLQKVEAENVMKKAIETWGKDEQLGMLLEESLELALATRKLLRDRKHHGLQEEMFIEQMASEIADVQIMISQAKIMFPGIDTMIEETKVQKIERLKKRLDNKTFNS